MINLAVSLPRYAELIGYDECAFFGVTYEGQEYFSCVTFWSEWQRQNVVRALTQAQKLIEGYVQFPLVPTWIVGAEGEDIDSRYIDQQPYRGNPLRARWCKVIGGGVRAESTIAAAAVVNYSDPDIATVGPLAATIGSTSEVKVFYPGTDRPIVPTKITYSGGNLSLEIPRCRLLLPNLLYEVGPDNGMDKGDTDLFQPTVEIVREYNDPSTQAVLVKSDPCSATGCATETASACIRVKSYETGTLEIQPATYADGSWAPSRLCGCYSDLQLNYRAGLRTVPEDLENVLVRLAHALMPEEPCGCSVTQNLWKRDHHVPEILTRERINCPFGYNDGAWFAYTWAKNNAVVRGFAL